jgi:hypothetical protein
VTISAWLLVKVLVLLLTLLGIVVLVALEARRPVSPLLIQEFSKLLVQKLTLMPMMTLPALLLAPMLAT